MPSIRKKGRTFFACITLADGSRTQLSTRQRDLGAPAERAEARRKALQIAALYEEQARGNATEAQIRRSIGSLFLRVNGRRLAFAQTDTFLAEWLARVKLRKATKTWERYEKVIRDFLAALGPKGAVPLDDITPQDVQSFVDNQLSQGKRARTVRLIAKVLNAPFNQALRQGVILTNPIAAADLPEGMPESREPFTWTQVSALIATAQGEWRTATLLGAFIGARLGDCVSMRWANVDLEAKVIRYRPSKTRNHAKDVVAPLHPALEAHLVTLRASHSLPAAEEPAKDFLCPALARCNISGRSGLSRQFRAIMAKAGIHEKPSEHDVIEIDCGPKPAGGPGAAQKPTSSKKRRISRLGFHSMRHTFTTELANAGVTVETRMALTGHSTARMNETYTHRGLDLLRAAVTKLPALPA